MPLSKIKFNEVTLLYILLSLLEGFFKNTILILFIVLIHELGHVYFLRHYEYPITKIEIFPFGGLTTTDKPINTPIKKEMWIALGGILFQLLLFLIMYAFYHFSYISENTFKLFNYYNRFIIFFNLIPIIPLDGYILLKGCIEKSVPYYYAYWITFFLSISILLIGVVLRPEILKNNLITFSFLLYKFLEYFKNRKNMFNRFYLERLLYEHPYEQIKHEKKEEIKLLKKDTLHFFKKGEKYYHEKEILRKKFDINTYF